jgi:hypothetical protein
VTRPNLFLATAILGFPIVAAFVAAAAPSLALLQPRAPLALAANHLVTLGWGTMAALGALYQLLPAAAGVRGDPAATAAVTVHWVAHTVGVALMAIGFGGGRIVLLAVGGAVAAAGLCLAGVRGPAGRGRRDHGPSDPRRSRRLELPGRGQRFSFLLGYGWLPRLWAAGRRPPSPAEPG